MASLGLPEAIIIMIIISGTLFWLWMLIDCAANEPNTGMSKIVWILIIVFTYWIGAALYFLVRRRQRIAEMES